MKTFKDIVLGMLAIIALVFLVLAFAAFILLIVYLGGWATGWLLHLVVGPDIILGMTFEQFIGMVYVIAGILASGKAAVSANVDKKIEQRIDKVVADVKKEYRGY